MLDVKIEKEHLNELHAKKVQSDPHKFSLGKLSHSGRHIHDLTEENV